MKYQLPLDSSMYKVKISPIAQEEFGVESANDAVSSIMTSLSKFQEFPLLGRPLSNLIDVPTDYMYFVIEKNYVFYRIEDSTVRVIRILSTRQDFMKILFGK